MLCLAQTLVPTHITPRAHCVLAVTCRCAVVCSLPPQLAAKLLQLRFQRDQALSWKFELVRRREALATAEADAKVTAAVSGS